jgi:hypothetical protein
VSGQAARNIGQLADVVRPAPAQAEYVIGVVLRLGLLDGPGAGHDQPNPALGASLHTEDAGRALLAALTVPSGIYNVCRDGERVSNRRFAEATGWRPQR